MPTSAERRDHLSFGNDPAPFPVAGGDLGKPCMGHFARPGYWPRADTIRDLLWAAVALGRIPSGDVRGNFSQCTRNAGSHSSQETLCCFIESRLFAEQSRRSFQRCEAQHLVDTYPMGEPLPVMAHCVLDRRGIRPWRQAHRERGRHLENRSRATASFAGNYRGRQASNSIDGVPRAARRLSRRTDFAGPGCRHLEAHDSAASVLGTRTAANDAGSRVGT